MTRRGRHAFVVLALVMAVIGSGFVPSRSRPVAAQEATASPSASSIPMLVVDLPDTDLGYVDILGLGIALDGDTLVLTMRLTEPIPMDRPPSEERLDYVFVLDTGVSVWSVSFSPDQAGLMLGVVSDMGTGTSVDLPPGAVMLDGSLLTIAVPISVLGQPCRGDDLRHGDVVGRRRADDRRGRRARPDERLVLPGGGSGAPQSCEQPGRDVGRGRPDRPSATDTCRARSSRREVRVPRPRDLAAADVGVCAG